MSKKSCPSYMMSHYIKMGKTFWTYSIPLHKYLSMSKYHIEFSRRLVKFPWYTYDIKLDKTPWTFCTTGSIVGA